MFFFTRVETTGRREESEWTRSRCHNYFNAAFTRLQNRESVIVPVLHYMFNSIR
jgi:hypothetical protein